MPVIQKMYTSPQFHVSSLIANCPFYCIFRFCFVYALRLILKLPLTDIARPFINIQRPQGYLR